MPRQLTGRTGWHRSEVQPRPPETRAHRLAWHLTNGAIPPGLLIRHAVCDNPPCCNPRHLAAGTAAQNTADMMARGRNSNRKKPCDK